MQFIFPPIIINELKYFKVEEFERLQFLLKSVTSTILAMHFVPNSRDLILISNAFWLHFVKMYGKFKKFPDS